MSSSHPVCRVEASLPVVSNTSFHHVALPDHIVCLADIHQECICSVTMEDRASKSKCEDDYGASYTSGIGKSPVSILNTALIMGSQMSAWLARPAIITEEPSKFPFPTLRLRLEGEEEAGGVSPFTHVLFQTQLCQIMSQPFELENGVFPPQQIQKLDHQLEEWTSRLPKVFALKNPDTSFDRIKPWLEVQRPNLHAIIRMVQLAPLKAYVTKLPGQMLSRNDEKYRDMGVDCALQLLEAATALHDLEFPSNAQFCTSLFSIFDTGITLGAAVLHDRTYTLPKRQESLIAIHSCLNMLQQYSFLTKIGTVSHNFLSDLVRACPLLPQEREMFGGRGKRRKVSSSGSNQSSEQFTPESGDLDGSQSIPPVPIPTSAPGPILIPASAAAPALVTSDMASLAVAVPDAQPIFSNPDLPLYNNIDQGWLDNFFPWDQIGLGDFRNSAGSVVAEPPVVTDATDSYPMMPSSSSVEPPRKI